MPRPIHFEIPTQNPERARDFYTGVFGWQFTRWDGPQEYWLISTGEGPGIDGGLIKREGPVANTVDVPSLQEALQSVESRGGKIVVPPMIVENVGEVAYCTDPDGNIFGLMQAMQP